MANENEEQVIDAAIALNEWVEKTNKDANDKAAELQQILGCEVDAVVFVVNEESKDAAVGFLRKPDAKQAFKIIRQMGDNYETGVELIARAQLVRDADLKAKGFEGAGSDARFMDANGKYEIKDSTLNLSLLLRAGKLIEIFQDQFKKK